MVNMAGIVMAPELLPAAGQSGRYQGIGRNTGAARLFSILLARQCAG